MVALLWLFNRSDRATFTESARVSAASPPSPCPSANPPAASWLRPARRRRLVIFSNRRNRRNFPWPARFPLRAPPLQFSRGNRFQFPRRNPRCALRVAAKVSFAFSFASIQRRAARSSNACSTDSSTIFCTAASSTSTADFISTIFSRPVLRVAREDVQNAVRINFKLHAHARHAARRGLEIEREFAEAPVVLRPLAFALQNMDEHVALKIHRRREQLAGLHRNRRVARDDDVHQAAKSFQPSDSGVTSSSRTCFETAAQNLRLDRRAERHGLVGILRRVQLRPAGLVKIRAEPQARRASPQIPRSRKVRRQISAPAASASARRPESLGPDPSPPASRPPARAGNAAACGR